MTIINKVYIILYNPICQPTKDICISINIYIKHIATKSTLLSHFSMNRASFLCIECLLLTHIA